MMFSKLSIGDKAPDFNFETPWDNGTNFYQATGNHIAILIFLRYIGCPICQVEMSRIKKNIDFADRKKAIVFIVLQSSPENVAAVASQEDWPFTIICDPQAKIFQQYQVETGGMIKYLHPAGLIAAVKAIHTGNRHGKFEGKETQLPASFIITPDKIIKYAYYGKRINDVPSLEILAAYIE
ncbi:MAG TPA: redoxin domain-containing protein [Bacillota bacterium]|nr:redoxin domain-containing protein [Bacillota bacterium]